MLLCPPPPDPPACLPACPLASCLWSSVRGIRLTRSRRFFYYLGSAVTTIASFAYLTMALGLGKVGQGEGAVGGAEGGGDGRGVVLMFVDGGGVVGGGSTTMPLGRRHGREGG